MKRFAFRLQVLLKYKLDLEKEQKARLVEIQQILQKLLDGLHSLEENRDSEMAAYREEGQRGTTRDRMQTFIRYIDLLKDAIEEQQRRIEEARAEKSRRQAKLLRTMKEIKTLNKLRDAQYQEYLAEVAKEEEKIIGDIVSFNTAAGDRAAL